MVGGVHMCANMEISLKISHIFSKTHAVIVLLKYDTGMSYHVKCLWNVVPTNREKMKEGTKKKRYRRPRYGTVCKTSSSSSQICALAWNILLIM